MVDSLKVIDFSITNDLVMVSGKIPRHPSLSGENEPKKSSKAI